MDLLLARMKEASVDFAAIVAAPALASVLVEGRRVYSIFSGSFTNVAGAAITDGVFTDELADMAGLFYHEAMLGAGRKYWRPTGPCRPHRQQSLRTLHGDPNCQEVSDASGMNLMNVLTCKWDDRLLEACGGSALRYKIGPEPVPGGSNLGKVHKWWVERWGFQPDNPATVVSLSAPGDALLSLGTSTTFLLSIPPADTPPKRFTNSHLLSHPTNLDAQIAMLCYKNGALAREQIRDRYADNDWGKFNTVLEQTPAEITGQHLHWLRAADNAHPRAILESQFLSILSRVEAILPEHAPHLKRLVLTGGSSANQTIRQLAADLFGMKAYVSATKEAAGLGGAMLAKYAWWKQINGAGDVRRNDWWEMPGMTCVAEPRDEVTQIYKGLVSAYRLCEEDVVSRSQRKQA
ncbi:D-xylulose kinase [Salix suchowensis]|nr:D-xylulose kinase [Salix suchowensis]